MSKFSELSKKIAMKDRISGESADKITAAIGRRKYGAKGMAMKAAAARRRNG